MSNEDDNYYNARICANSASSSSSTRESDTVSRRERNRQQDEGRRRLNRQRRALMYAGIPVIHEIATKGEVQRGGSVVGRRYTHRERRSRRQMIMNDYFVAEPKFPPHKFRRRYRMQR
jgi:hypothetical protein